MGAIYRPSSWVRVRVVAKDLNTPTFDAAGGGTLKLEPQVRVGFAVNPYSTLTLTADVDATSNKTFVPGVKSQLLSLGLEQTILSEFLSFRIGTFKICRMHQLHLFRQRAWGCGGLISGLMPVGV